MKQQTRLLMLLTICAIGLISCSEMREQADEKWKLLNDKVEKADSLINFEMNRVERLDSIINKEMKKINMLDSIIESRSSVLDSILSN
ncbi:hypothetical protein FNH22_06190 [Fulvivirga sp. M361]|uniref:hypothetical protein n=1 Tax=Fulvivirga sp. M361 TaxID=2594266 RepID=UPI00117B8AE7|nr:hypothetical protein [Fulvivirga sp. M361]TRX60632.1 hypothetical protein FNH22_06190 [Fulvivirga sp. M361]